MSFTVFMAGWGWVIFSVINTVFTAIVYLLNQYAKLPGHLLVFWSRTATVLMLAPFMHYVPLPTHPQFYIAVALTALFGAFADIRTFNVASEFGGGIVSRVQPLVIILSFFAWFFFDPAQIGHYAANPGHTTLVVLSLTGIVYFSSRMGKCHISRAAFIRMFPALLGYTLTTVLSKYALLQGSMAGVVFGYMYVQCAVAVPLLGLYAFWRGKHSHAHGVVSASRRMFFVSILLAAGWVVSMTFKNYAMIFIPNPSYQTAINQMAPVFIAAFYWLVRHKEEGDVRSGMGVVLCTALLILVTGGIKN